MIFPDIIICYIFKKNHLIMFQKSSNFFGLKIVLL